MRTPGDQGQRRYRPIDRPPHRGYTTVSGIPVPIADHITGWEIWVTALDRSVCPICRAMHGLIFPRDFGPRPPKHPLCRCARYPVDVDTLPPALLIRIGLRATAGSGTNRPR